MKKAIKTILGVAAVTAILASCGGGSTSTSDETENTSGSSEVVDVDETVAAVETTVAKVVTPTSFKVLSDREWKLMNNNPDAMSGTGVRIAGSIIQFDAFTGTGTFKAVIYNTGASRAADPYFNNITVSDISGSETLLANFLKGDKFVCDCVINKADSYSTQDGGTKLTVLMDAINLKVG
jgi:hypothetical protein